MATWKKVAFIVVLVSFIGLSVFFTFYAIARDTFEFEEQTAVGGMEGLDGWVFYGFNGNPGTTEITVDFVRDKKGQNPDETKPIVGIDDFTVVSDEYVETIHIGKDVQYISEQAFYYCKQLKTVTVDAENEYFCAVDGVLYNKDKTKLLLHPIRWGSRENENGELVPEDTFEIPEGVERIGGYSFYKNEFLVHLTIPASVREIGDMAFFGCWGMWSVWLPEGLQSIGADAFSNCGSMSPVMYIPASVQTIDHHAFYNCSSLSVFYLGAVSEDAISLGEGWLPDSLKGKIMNYAPTPVFGKTQAEALAEKERMDKEAAENG